MSIITSKQRLLNAKRFFEQAESDVDRNLYFFMGKSMPWTTESLPDTPVDTVEDEIECRYNMISLKKISESDLSYVIPRINWTNDTVFLPYDHTDASLFLHPTATEITTAGETYTPGSFYCLTDENNVYKCLEVPLVAATKSTVKPTGQLTTAFRTSDGYLWKYMYTVSASDYDNFVNNNWMAVKTLTVDNGSQQWQVQQAAVDGAIESIKITNVGSGYNRTYPAVYDESDAGYYETLDSGSAAGSSTCVLDSVASNQNDFYNGASIYIQDGAGSGQLKVISDYVGTSRTVTIVGTWTETVDNTSVYKILPTVTVSGDGSGCNAIARVAADYTISRIDVLNAGSDYRYATAAITDPAGSSSTIVPVISPLGGHGLDAVSELGGYYVMTSVVLSYDEDDFPTENDYRQEGIIADIENLDGTIASATTRSANGVLTIDSPTGTFSVDEEIRSNASPYASAWVIEYTLESGTGYIRYYQDSASGFLDFVAGDVVTGQTSSASGQIAILGVTAPDVDKFSGNILYRNNKRRITRQTNQLEELKLVIKF